MNETGVAYEVSHDEKRRQLMTLCHGEPDAIYLLSGISEVIIPKSGKKIYKPGSYVNVDWNGFMHPGKARALAAATLAEYFPQATVAVNSNTFNKRNPEAPTDAEVMAEFLEQKGVDPGRIVRQDRSTTTFTELIELVKATANYNWQHLVVVAGATQQMRAQEMLRQIETLHDPSGAWEDPEFRAALEKLRGSQPNITIVAAEDILPIRGERYAGLIAAARETEAWKAQAELERGAVEQLRAGKYWQKK